MGDFPGHQRFWFFSGLFQAFQVFGDSGTSASQPALYDAVRFIEKQHTLHLIKDFLNEFPIIIRCFPQTDEKFGFLLSQIDRITGCDDQSGMVSI